MAGRPLPEVLDLIARGVEAARPGVLCAILRLERGAGTLHPVAAPSLPAALIAAMDGQPTGPDGTLCGRAAWLAEGLVCEDVTVDPRWAAHYRAAAAGTGIRAACAEPITDAAGTVLAVIMMYREVTGPPTMAETIHLRESARLTELAITHMAERQAAEHQAELFRAGQRLARMGTIHLDLTTAIWTVSRAWADHVGLDSPTLTSETVRAHVHPQDLDYLAAILDRVVSEGRAEYDLRLIHRRTGEILYVRVFAELRRDREDHPSAIVGVVQDITEQTAAMIRLADSEARFRGLFDALPLDVTLWRREDGDFILADVNPATRQDRKDHVRSLLGTRLSTFYQGCPDLIHHIRDCARDGEPRRLERAYRMPGAGEERHFAFMIASVTPDLVMATAEDIQDRKTAEADSRETAAVLVAGQKMARMGSYEYDIRQDRWALSDTWLMLSGAHRAPVKTEELLDWIHPDDRARALAAFQTLLRGEACQMEHRVIHYRTGETRILRAYGELVRDDFGTPVKLRGLVQDITEEKRRERTLTDNIAQLALAERIAGVGSWTLDPASGIVNWSENVYRIYERDPALGPPTLEEYRALYEGEALEAFRAALCGAIRDGQPYDLMLPLRLPDGRAKWIHALGQPEPERGPAGHIVHGTLQDVTDRRRAEEFRDDIDRIIRHDLRSPIAATVAGINILRLSDSLTPDQRQTLDMMERANQRQLTLLDTSMTLYRMEAGTYELTPEPVAIGGILDEVCGELAHLAETREAHVRVSTGTTHAVALGDAWLCRALLSNLIRNALEALPEDGPRTVDVVLDESAAQTLVIIRNPGVVPEEIRDRFFEKYATSGKSGGTGLGTYSAHVMARVQGGSVTLDSSEPGSTTITVSLPRVDAAAAAAGFLPGAVAGQPGTAGAASPH